MATPHSFNDWLKANNHVGPSGKWVLARRTARMVMRYGEDTVFFTQKRHAELVEEHRVALREDAITAIMGQALDNPKLGAFRRALTEAFEAGRKAR